MLQVFTLRDTTCHEVVKRISFSFIARLLSDQGSVAFRFFVFRLLQTMWLWYKPAFIPKNGLHTRKRHDYHYCCIVIDYAELMFNLNCCCVSIACNMSWILCFWWVNGVSHSFVFTSCELVGSVFLPQRLRRLVGPAKLVHAAVFISNRLVSVCVIV
jgi:hypothetical protein